MFVLGSIAAGMALHLGIFFTQSWAVIIALSFGVGFATSLRIQVGFNYLIEFFPKKSQIMAGTVYCIIDATTYMFTTIYFWKISTD